MSEKSRRADGRERLQQNYLELRAKARFEGRVRLKDGRVIEYYSSEKERDVSIVAIRNGRVEAISGTHAKELDVKTANILMGSINIRRDDFDPNQGGACPVNPAIYGRERE